MEVWSLKWHVTYEPLVVDKPSLLAVLLTWRLSRSIDRPTTIDTLPHHIAVLVMRTRWPPRVEADTAKVVLYLPLFNSKPDLGWIRHRTRDLHLIIANRSNKAAY